MQGEALGGAEGWTGKLPEAAMPKQRLISIVDDDQLFRNSMRKLVMLFGYTVEAFPSAADFLGSPLLSDRLLGDRHPDAGDDGH